MKKNIFALALVTSFPFSPLMHAWPETPYQKEFREKFRDKDDREGPFIPGVGGKVPEDMYNLYKYLKVAPRYNPEDPKENYSSPLMLLGEFGVGRSLAVEMAAHENGIELMAFDLIELRKQHGKNIYEALDNIYTSAQSRVEKTGNPVIVLFKNVGVTESSERQTNSYLDATFYLNRGKTNEEKARSYIKTVITARSPRDFSEETWSRYRKIKFYKPDKEDREDIIKVCARKHAYHIPKWLPQKAAALSAGVTGKNLNDGFYFLMERSQDGELKKSEKARLFYDLIKEGTFMQTTALTAKVVTILCIMYGIRNAPIAEVLTYLKKICNTDSDCE